jgi:hypothetical protein
MRSLSAGYFYPFPYRQRICPHWHWTHSEPSASANQTPLPHKEQLKNASAFSQASISLLASGRTTSKVCDARLAQDRVRSGHIGNNLVQGHR